MHIWLRSSGVNLTPDRTVKWRRVKSGDGILCLAEDAPDISKRLLTDPAPRVGSFICKGLFGSAYKVEADADYVLKESAREFLMTDERWDRYSGLAAISLNVALQIGLQRIGDGARLPSGARLTTPAYYGAFLSSRLVRLLMSHEPGRPGTGFSEQVIGTEEERNKIYDRAVGAVGWDPATLESYDDKSEDLIVREGTSRIDIVVLDVCNFPQPRQTNAAQN